jgi:hypothetical protein
MDSATTIDISGALPSTERSEDLPERSEAKAPRSGNLQLHGIEARMS